MSCAAAMNRLDNRVSELEQAHGAQSSYKGVMRIIWHGPEDDAMLTAAERETEASGKFLIVRRIIDTKEHSGHVG